MKIGVGLGRIIKVKVIPNSRVEEVTESEPVVIRVRAPPEKGKANLAVVKILSKHYGCRAKIIGGHSSRKKTVELEM